MSVLHSQKKIRFYLHMSKKSSTFVAEIKKETQHMLTINYLLLDILAIRI